MAFPAAWEELHHLLLLHLAHLPRPWRGVGLGAIPHPLPLCAPRLARLLLLLAVLGSEVDANAELLAVLGYGCSDSAFSAGAVAACCISISSQFGNRSGTSHPSRFLLRVIILPTAPSLDRADRDHLALLAVACAGAC